MSGLRARSADAKRARREALLDAAEAHVLRAGSAHALRIEEIARSVGLAKGSMYLYFPSKEALVIDLFERAFAAWTDACVGRELHTVGPLHEQVVETVVEATRAVPQAAMLVPAWLAALAPMLDAAEFAPARARLLVQVGRGSRWLGHGLGISRTEAFELWRQLLVLFVGMTHMCGDRTTHPHTLNGSPAAPLQFPLRDVLLNAVANQIAGWHVRRLT